jgi:PAS domain S-box-containing protein
MNLATALIYWVIVAIWLTVLTTILVVFKRNPSMFGPTRLLLAVVAIDTFRNIVENVYFGLYFGARFGLFPAPLGEFLGNPGLLIAPKLANVAAGCVVLGLLLKRWLPIAMRERQVSEQTIEGLSRYRMLLEAAPDPMVVVTEVGEIVLLNHQAEKQFGYRDDELLKRNIKTILPEGFEERLVADALRSEEIAQAQHISTGIELSGRRKDGSAFPIELMLSPLKSAANTLAIAAIRDVTARKAVEALLEEKVNALNRSNEELEQFAYVASHDLQEPLRMVASYMQLLSKRYKGKLDADADEFIAFAVDGAARMQRLIRDLLAFSRVGSRGQSLLDFSSEEALQQALVNLRGAIEDSGALVTHDPLPVVMADGSQLTQLFQNLVGNAIKYQNPGVPRVHIAAARSAAKNKRWTFSVQDNGLGIESQQFDRIFGMFQRLHKRDAFEGTGIGLAICKKIVERHGGSIWVESQPGRGSTFRFALAESGAVT